MPSLYIDHSNNVVIIRDAVITPDGSGIVLDADEDGDGSGRHVRVLLDKSRQYGYRGKVYASGDVRPLVN